MRKKKMKQKDEKIIDVKNKTPEEIYDIYKDIAKDTMILREIRKKTNDFNQIIDIYQKIKNQQN